MRMTDEGVGGFAERIRKLVVASLAEIDVKQALEKQVKSLDAAAEELKRERKNIDEMLGSMDGAASGPAAPKLPRVTPSMDVREFTLSALTLLGASIRPYSPGVFVCERDGIPELISFRPQARFPNRVRKHYCREPALRKGAHRPCARPLRSIR